MIYRTIAWFIILFACFYGVGIYPLFDDNEGLYASVARNMLSSGQFIIPHLNGVPYLEKPPMLYWLMAGSMSMFGVNEFATELVPALMLFITAAMTKRFITIHTKSESTGFAAAFILVTSVPLLAMERMIMCDMIMTCFLSAALMQFFDWYTSHNNKNLLGFWAFLALAVLSKGLSVIIISGGTIAIFLLWQGASFKNYLKIISPAGILLFFAIAAPWHIAASVQEPGFAWFYFINEHLYRYLNMREPHDYYTGHIWYYLPRILGYLVPWTFFLLLFTKKDRSTEPEHVSLKRLLWSWFWFSLAFFSLSGGKANYYMIAGMPAIAALLALQMEIFIAQGSRIPHSVASGGLMLIITVLCLSRYFCNANSGDFYDGCQAAYWPSIMWAVLYCVIAIILCWRVDGRWLSPLLAGSIIFLLPLLIPGVNIASGRVSQKEVATYLNASPHGDIAVYQEFEELSALAFYIDKPLLIVDTISNDLLYGQRQPGGGKYFLSLSDWATHSPSIPMIMLKQKIPVVMDSLRAMNVDTKHICILKRFERAAIMEKCE